MIEAENEKHAAQDQWKNYMNQMQAYQQQYQQWYQTQEAALANVKMVRKTPKIRTTFSSGTSNYEFYVIISYQH